MADLAARTALTFQKAFRRFTANPILVKELRSRMRGGRAFVVLTGYLLLLSSGLAVVLLMFLASGSAGSSVLAIRQSLGKAIFGVLVSVQILTMCFIAPALTSGAIASEKELQTFDLLRTTLLPAWAIVVGKLLTALAYLALLLFASLPLLSLALLFGGVALIEIFLAVLVLLVTALGYSALGLFFSSITRRSLTSTVLTFAVALILVFGIPIFLVVTVGALQTVFPGLLNQTGTLVEVLVIGAGWLLVSLNPPATVLISEIILIEQQSPFYMELPLNQAGVFPFISPWIGYTLLYLLLTLGLVLWTGRRVRRPER